MAAPSAMAMVARVRDVHPLVGISVFRIYTRLRACAAFGVDPQRAEKQHSLRPGAAARI
jgi:hypothetical protein